jgi:hypothetical protein
MYNAALATSSALTNVISGFDARNDFVCSVKVKPGLKL